MPLYSYRCTDCSNHFDIRHGFHEDNTHVCNNCKGKLAKYYGKVVVAASCMPTRSNIDFEGTKLNETNKDKDMPAFKRLVQSGVQPNAINGAAHLEKHANHKMEIESGVLLKSNKDVSELTYGLGKD